MSKIYKAVSYLRISIADENKGESESLSNQRKGINDFISSQGDIELIDEKIDDGVSGLVFDRPSFLEMMDRVYKHEIDCIIVKDLSRLGRDYVKTGDYLRKIFPKYGVRFISILDNVDTKNMKDISDDLSVTLKTIINDSYSRDISKKTRSSIHAKQQNGEYCGPNPVYGYMKSPDNKNSLVIDEVAAVIVREIFSLKKDGFSASRIANLLNERMVPSPSVYKGHKRVSKSKDTSKNNSLWSAQTIIRMLNDDTYIGVLTQGKQTTINYKTKVLKQRPKDEWAVFADSHDPIISKGDFDLVGKLMNLDTRTSPNKDSVYLFSGLLVCGCCGNRMVRKTVPYNGKKYFYYSCTTGKKKGCNNKAIKEDKLIEIVTDSIKIFTTSVLDLDELLDRDGITELQANITEKYKKKLDQLAEKQKENFFNNSRLYESLLNKVITQDEYNTFKKIYLKELEEIKKSEEQELRECQTLLEGNKPQWLDSFKEVRDMTDLNRRTVIQLLESIVIGEKIQLNFRHQIDYDLMTAMLTSQEELAYG